jgi:hypothetical protein
VWVIAYVFTETTRSASRMAAAAVGGSSLLWASRCSVTSTSVDAPTARAL